MAALLNEKAGGGDLDALEIQVFRGDVQARKKLWDMFAGKAGGKRNPKVVSAVERTITYGDLPESASFLKSSEPNSA